MEDNREIGSEAKGRRSSRRDKARRSFLWMSMMVSRE
jgi:hypothetical protein